jgi:hypothetical protein
MSIRARDIKTIYHQIELAVGAVGTGATWRLEALWGGRNAAGPLYLALIFNASNSEYVPLVIALTQQGAPVSATLVTGSQSTTLTTAMTNMVTLWGTESVVSDVNVDWNDTTV